MKMNRFFLNLVAAIVSIGVVSVDSFSGEKLKCSSDEKDDEQAPDDTPNKSEFKSTPMNYIELVNNLDSKIVKLKTRAKVLSKSWMAQAEIAKAYMAKARLEGDYKNYVEAQNHLQIAFSLAPPNSGPIVEQVELDFTLHRTRMAVTNLKKLKNRVQVQKATGQWSKNIAASMNLQVGNLTQARNSLQNLYNESPSYTVAFGLALSFWKSGEFSKAEMFFDQALKYYNGIDKLPIAWVHLQKGLLNLDQGKYAKALEDYLAAEKFVAGWWLIEEHKAEVFVNLGDLKNAQRIYERVVTETKNPELMVALAELYQKIDRKNDAEKLIAEARTGFKEQRKLIPEAASGHALDFYLDYGAEGESLIDIAIKNYQSRPGLEASIQLAKALMQDKKTIQAQKILNRVYKKGYRSKELENLISKENNVATLGDL